MFGEHSAEDIHELYDDPGSRLIIKLIVLAYENVLSNLKLRQVDSDHIEFSVSKAKAQAYFKSASLVEREAWNTSEFSESYQDMLSDMLEKNSIYNSIKIINSWLQEADNHGFRG